MHMKDPHDVFFFIGNGGYHKYVGMDYARGVHCTQWFANYTGTTKIDGHQITVKSTRNHWFSAPDWKDAGCVAGDACNLELPIRTVSEGSIFNHTTGKTEEFHDHYEYLNFIPGKPPAFLFKPGAQINCVKFEVPPPTTTKLFKLPSQSTQTTPKLGTKAEYLAWVKKRRGRSGMPRIPKEYTVYMEVNRVNQKETINVREYFDFNTNRVRTDKRVGNQMVTEIRDFNTMVKFTLTDDDLSDDPNLSFNSKNYKCESEPLTMEKNEFAGKTRHMKSPAEVFFFSPTGAERLVDLDYSRGIHTTQWFANSEETETIDGHVITTKAQRNHWFSAPDWSDANCADTTETWKDDKGNVIDCNDMQAPIRTVSEGTYYNHTDKKTTKFHDHYEYVDFLPGPPAKYLFDPKSFMSGNACLPKAFAKPKKMPQVPAAYIAVVEINRVETLETINVHQYLDFTHQRVRVDVYDNSGLNSVIHDYPNRVKYTITDPDVQDDPEIDSPVDDKCVKEVDDSWDSALHPGHTRLNFQKTNLDSNEDTAMVQASFSTTIMHFADPKEQFTFTNPEGVPEVYVGVDFARGIKCTQWFANNTGVEIINSHLITTTEKRNHWFSAPDWSDAGCPKGKECFLQLPIRVVSEGTYYNHTDKKTTKFHDHYEYVSFLPGNPPDYLYNPSATMDCEESKEPEPTAEPDRAIGVPLNPGVDAYPNYRSEEDYASRLKYNLPALSETSKKHKLTNKADYDPKNGMPLPPDQYTVYMEINRVESKETINIREYFDFPGNRIRTDMRDGNAMSSIIRNFNTNTMFHQTDNDLSDNPTMSFDANQFVCEKMPLNKRLTKGSFAETTRHMKSPEEVFMFSPTGNEVYVGLDYARGIHSTQWYAEVEETNVFMGHVITTKSTRNHWFSAPDWSDANCDGTGHAINGYLNCAELEAPVRTVAEGTIFNHTTGKTTKFHDHYEYISFLPGKPPRDLFEPTDPTRCVSVAAMAGRMDGMDPPRVSAASASRPTTISGGSGKGSSWSGGKTFGVIVLVGLIAAVVGFAAIKIRQRRANSGASWGVSSGLTPGGVEMSNRSGGSESYGRTGSREGILTDTI